MSTKQFGKTKAGTRVTMHDVAARAGVSQMTVSRVMRDAGAISPEVRKKVVKAAAEIGYVHNRLAGGMRTTTTPLVGVVVPTLQNRVFTEVLTGISDALATQGIRPVFGVSEYSLEAEEALVLDFLSWRPRGLVLAGLEHTDTVRQMIAAADIRVSEVMDMDGDPIMASFGVSQAEAGRDMARHMLDRGYRRIAYAASQGGRDKRAGKRFEAFAAVIRDAGGQIVDDITAEDPSSLVLGRQLTGTLLARSCPDAIYFSNDDLAGGGLMHCLAEGISVPKDVALAGFNGLSFLEALPQRITTTATPRYEIGRDAALFVADPSRPAPDGGRQDFGTRLIVGNTT
ncbi:LacI family DNA-binding transcriptional regulator [Pseudoprimorskyibacter insulae]|uniref:HTH-type transcriptional regulator GntR n=1 Tax=Pseudoprimorskyibacter insulae TaxID=1695997 RepID=A0A2R8AWJ7_9RHOB|nr:LacI family DNA-binding transcriptional regulator [Pseudoprimorskyibacter insulae]SPF80249.1 HTH-type transcriptional regulator GntR [Pseudoprimorskyibacter insulae]